LLSFFRVNATYQIVSLVLFFTLLRLPFLWSEVPLLVPELSWMLVGEQMSRGFMLYRDVWDNVSPFSGMVYWSIDTLVGRSQMAYQGVAFAVSLFQILYFNYVLRARDVFPERSYVPGAIYALFLNISFDLATLSPMLMATTFLLLALGVLIKMLERRQVTNEIFEMGLYIGIATLFYLPSALFMVWAFISLIFYTGATLRQHVLGFFGAVFPLLMVMLFFYLNDGVENLNQNLLTSVFQVKQYVLNDFSSLIISLFFPLVIGGFGFMRMLSNTRLVNYQSRVQQTMAIWFLVALLMIPLMQYLAPMQFVPFFPVAAFFSTFYFQSFKKRWIAELLFLGAMGGILLIQYQGLLALDPQLTLGRLENLRTRPALLPEAIRQKRILVLGEHEGEYLNNYTATPYLNWDLSRNDLGNLDNFESVIHIYDNFRQDPPDYIIDKENIMPRLFERVPALRRRYKPSPWKGIYQKVS
jgi:hypothetical protein